MTNFISNSPLCFNSFSGHASCIDRFFSEGVNAPIAEVLESNLGVTGSVISGFICTAIKIVSVIMSTLVFLVALPCTCTHRDDQDIDNDDLLEVEFDPTIWNSRLEWVKQNVRKKRDDDYQIEYLRLKKLGYIDLNKLKKLEATIDEKFFNQFKAARIKRIYAEAMTIAAVFEDTHFAFFHAQARVFSVIQYVIKEIVKRKSLSETHNRQFLRDPMLTKSLEHQELVPYLKNAKQSGIMTPTFDNNYMVQQYLVAADANLFNIRSMESAFHFLCNDSNVLDNTNEIVSKILDSHFKLDKHSKNVLKNRIYDALSLLKDEGKPYEELSGNIFVFLLPKKNISKFAYVAEPFGLPVDDHLGIFDDQIKVSTEKSLKHDVTSPDKPNLICKNSKRWSDLETSQYRLFMPAIQKEMQSTDSSIAAFFVTATPKILRKEIKNELKEIVDYAIAASLESNSTGQN